MKVSFSIVIPIYNAETTLHDTLQSVARQHFQHFEIVAVNDGSTDGSMEVLQRWHHGHAHLPLKVINQPNLGLGAARNAGIAASTNTWVALLDADDLWMPQKLQRTAIAIEENQEADVIFHGFATFGTRRNRNRKGYPINNIEQLLTQGNPIMPSAMAARTDVLKKFTFSTDKDIHGAEDLDLWLKLLKDGSQFFHLNETLTLYRQVGGMSTRLEEHLEKVFRVIDTYYAQGWFGEETYLKAKNRKHWEAGRFYHKRGEFKKADHYYTLSDTRDMKAAFLKILSRVRITA